MTQHDIDNMPAGPELNRLACHAVGIVPIRNLLYGGKSYYPAISTDTGIAVEVAMVLWTGSILSYGHDLVWTCSVPARDPAKHLQGRGNTAPLAIARAMAKLDTEQS